MRTVSLFEFKNMSYNRVLQFTKGMYNFLKRYDLLDEMTKKIYIKSDNESIKLCLPITKMESENLAQIKEIDRKYKNPIMSEYLLSGLSYKEEHYFAVLAGLYILQPIFVDEYLNLEDGEEVSWFDIRGCKHEACDLDNYEHTMDLIQFVEKKCNDEETLSILKAYIGNKFEISKLTSRLRKILTEEVKEKEIEDIFISQ